jgi:sec-independent protein translocase protein TatA
MFGLGHTELIIILLIGGIIFGAKKLPDIGSGMGSAIKNFKKSVSTVEEEIKKEPEKVEAGNTPL